MTACIPDAGLALAETWRRVTKNRGLVRPGGWGWVEGVLQEDSANFGSGDG